MSGSGTIGKLRADHDLARFDCGTEGLDRFLERHALANQQANSAQTYVLCCESKVVGYNSLTAGPVEHEVAPSRVKKGLAHHPVPVMILARLAVDRVFTR
ncbi:MAG: hypothetical protein ACYCYP_09185 [Leptospirales bacterium]